MRTRLTVALLVCASCLSSPEGSSGGDELEVDAAASCPQPTDAPGGGCPPECTTCDGATCVIECSGVGCGIVECPADFDCQVSCVGKDRCVGARVSCPPEYGCSLLCSGEDACENLTLLCGEGPCEIACVGHALSCSATEVSCGGGPCVATCDVVTTLPELACGASCRCEPCDLPARAGASSQGTAPELQ